TELTVRSVLCALRMVATSSVQGSRWSSSHRGSGIAAASRRSIGESPVPTDLPMDFPVELPVDLPMDLPEGVPIDLTDFLAAKTATVAPPSHSWDLSVRVRSEGTGTNRVAARFPRGFDTVASLFTGTPTNDRSHHCCSSLFRTRRHRCRAR